MRLIFTIIREAWENPIIKNLMKAGFVAWLLIVIVIWLLKLGDLDYIRNNPLWLMGMNIIGLLIGYVTFNYLQKNDLS
jgi:general stress protein CsbA